MTNISYGERNEILDRIVDKFYSRACISKFFKTLNLENYVDRYILFEVMQRYRDNEEIKTYIDNYIDSIRGITKVDNLSVTNEVSNRLLELDRIIKSEEKLGDRE